MAGFAGADCYAMSNSPYRSPISATSLNLAVRDGNIVSYQWKRPFDVLEMDTSGALLNPWWAMRDSSLLADATVQRIFPVLRVALSRAVRDGLDAAMGSPPL